MTVHFLECNVVHIPEDIERYTVFDDLEDGGSRETCRLEEAKQDPCLHMIPS